MKKEDEKIFMSSRKFGKTYLMHEWMMQQIEKMVQPSDKPHIPFGIKIVANDIVPENEIWMVNPDSTGIKLKMEPPKLPDLTEQQMTMAARTFAAIYCSQPQPVFRREYQAEWLPTEVNLKVNLHRLDKRKKRRLKRRGQWELFQALRNEYALPDEIKKVFKK